MNYHSRRVTACSPTSTSANHSRRHFERCSNSLDLVRLLCQIRTIQHRLTELEVANSNASVGAPERILEKFVAVRSHRKLVKCGRLTGSHDPAGAVADAGGPVREYVRPGRVLAQPAARRKCQGAPPATPASGSLPDRRLRSEHDSGQPASRPVCNPCLRESVKSWEWGPIMRCPLPFPSVLESNAPTTKFRATAVRHSRNRR